MEISIRLRWAQGQKPIKIAPNATFQQFKSQISSLTGIAPFQQILKCGFPPKELVDAGGNVLIADRGIKNGETVLIEKAPSPLIVRRKVEDDNSCLFSAIGYLFENHDRTAAKRLRQVVADFIKNDPENYSDAVLGQPREQYCRWILKPQSWGGAIELAIFSKYYSAEIIAFDIQTQLPYRYGEGEGYDKVAFMIYDGIHYDALALSDSQTNNNESLDQTVLNKSHPLFHQLFDLASQLVKEENQKHGYTDIANFSLKCVICGQGLRGENQAQIHANQTAHNQFVEYS